jgi:large subunit ribosomal protein L9
MRWVDGCTADYDTAEIFWNFFVLELTTPISILHSTPPDSSVCKVLSAFYKIFMPLTELILTENGPGLGAEADVVKVRRGYARNYLLPRKMAYEVTPSALRQLNTLKQKRAEREARELNDAQELARRIGKAKFVFTLETGESGKAFGSVTAQDIVNRLKNEVGVDVDRHKISLERPIKDTGEHDVAIKLHHDVTAQLVFQVKSATESRDRGADATPAAAPEELDKKKRRVLRRKNEESKQEKK